MKIAIFGSGGVGGYFGGLLARAGRDVTFIARGAHLRAIRERGLQVRSVHGDFTVAPAQATDDPASLGPVDYVVVGLKHYHLAGAASQLKPLVGAETTVVPLLNGVDAHEILGNDLGEAHLVGGLCSIISMVESPGVIRQVSQLRRVVVGELDGSKSARVERLIQAWVECGAQAEHSDDILADIWTKFLFIASLSGVNALARATIGEMRSCPPTRELYVAAMREVEAIARSRSVNLPDDIVEHTLALTDRFESEATASMQRDVEAGKPFELEAFSGKIVRLGEELGVETPVHRALYALLRPALVKAIAGEVVS